MEKINRELFILCTNKFTKLFCILAHVWDLKKKKKEAEKGKLVAGQPMNGLSWQ